MPHSRVTNFYPVEYILVVADERGRLYLSDKSPRDQSRLIRRIVLMVYKICSRGAGRTSENKQQKYLYYDLEVQTYPWI